MSSPPTSPLSPRTTSGSPNVRRKNAVPPGFRAPPREKPKLSQMSVAELQALHVKNARILASPGASTSTYVERITAEQAAIVSQLEMHGMDVINAGMMNTRIGESSTTAPEPPMSRAIDAKRRALARFDAANGLSNVQALSMQEAIEIEQRAHAQDREREQRLMEKRRRQGLPIKGEVLSRAEVEARIWAFMCVLLPSSENSQLIVVTRNHKPTDSDLEDDDDDEDEDDDDPASWFDDDQDDGRKGQDIIEPDEEDLSNIIRIDHNKLHYSAFYEPRDDGD
ncbi:hypothetical protein VNI00_005663 [Paramarasmius palmivorus]|uniref:Uncharacterized protein n=1 Tax=Paramarasmius palmivorus TaxID=297713 RepID=A0AAW0DEQ8_9AGAR